MIRIFAVDDSNLALSALSHLLEAEGWSFEGRLESEGAVEAIAASAPHLVLLDVIMPGLSGIDVLKGLKGREDCAELPVIMVTAKTGAEDVRAALDAGAFDYIRKPYEPVEVVARVRAALRVADYQTRLKQLSERDGLTGLLNHSTFMRSFERELSLSSAAGKPLAIAMMDIDHFKAVNDSHGHQAGDEVLAGIASLLEGAVGSSGKAGRYGGEEFAAWLGGFDLPMAERQAEAFRRLVAGSTWKIGDIIARITISSGVSAFIPGLESPGRAEARNLLAAADAALYRAKHEGRDRVSAFNLSDFLQSARAGSEGDSAG